MGKGDKNQKEKDPAANLNASSVPNRDIMQRLNFMFQASTLLHSVASGSCSEQSPEDKMRIRVEEHALSVNAPSSGMAKKAKGRRPRRDRKPKSSRKGLDALAQFYAQSIPIVAQRTTVKLDPFIKRGLCKGCNSPLIPGVTATTRVKKQSSHGHTVVYQCLGCSSSSRFPATQELSPSDATQAPSPKEPLVIDSMAMDVDVPSPRLHKQSRVPPLFARTDAGHVTFRGNLRFDVSEDKRA